MASCTYLDCILYMYDVRPSSFVLPDLPWLPFVFICMRNIDALRSSLLL